MFIIDYDGKQFKLKLTKFLEKDEFNYFLFYLRDRNVYYNQKETAWLVDCKKIDEFFIWFKRDSIEYTLTDEAIEKVKEIRNWYFSELLSDRKTSFDISILNAGVKSFQFQLEVINWCLKRNVMLNALDAGLGKTFISICQFSTLYKLGKIDSIIIIAPIGLSFHWKYEILEFVNVFKE